MRKVIYWAIALLLSAQVRAQPELEPPLKLLVHFANYVAYSSNEVYNTLTKSGWKVDSNNYYPEYQLMKLQFSYPPDNILQLQGPDPKVLLFSNGSRSFYESITTSLLSMRFKLSTAERIDGYLAEQYIFEKQFPHQIIFTIHKKLNYRDEIVHYQYSIFEL